MIDNIVVVKAWLRNVGRAPILPSDYHENISVNVKKPWRIVAVENANDLFRGVEFRWKRVSDIRFEAAPSLLNPGDSVSTNIYLTNTQFDKESGSDKPSEVNVEWKARIVNLRAFTEPPNPLDFARRSYWGIKVDLSGWALPFSIVAAMLFLALYLHLLSRAGFVRDMRPTAILLVLGSSFLSFAAAESMAAYLFGNTHSKLFGVDHWMNAPWIILHSVLLIFLYRKAKRGRANVG